MAILVDEPLWPNHGTMWAHLVSDASLDELHAFAQAGCRACFFGLEREHSKHGSACHRQGKNSAS